MYHWLLLYNTGPGTPTYVPICWFVIVFVIVSLIVALQLTPQVQAHVLICWFVFLFVIISLVVALLQLPPLVLVWICICICIADFCSTNTTTSLFAKKKPSQQVLVVLYPDAAPQIQSITSIIYNHTIYSNIFSQRRLRVGLSNPSMYVVLAKPRFEPHILVSWRSIRARLGNHHLWLDSDGLRDMMAVPDVTRGWLSSWTQKLPILPFAYLQ